MEKNTLVNKSEKKVRAKKVELPDLNLKEMYWIKFTEKCPEKELIGQNHLCSGEMVLIFLSQDYGVLC